MNGEILTDTDVMGKCDPYVTVECGAKPQDDDQNSFKHSHKAKKLIKEKSASIDEEREEDDGHADLDKTEVRSGSWDSHSYIHICSKIIYA